MPLIVEETFRAGASLGQVGVLTVILGPLTACLISEALAGQGSVQAMVLWGAAQLCAFLGPTLFLLQLWRRYQGTVHVRAEGIDHGGIVLTWQELENVDYRSGLLGGETTESIASRMCEAFDGFFAIILRRVELLFWLLAVFYKVGVSLLGLVTPWHPRVVIRLRHGGGTVVLRDIENGDRLARRAMGRIDGPNRVR